MNARATFGISALMSLISSILAATFFAWPWLRTLTGAQALLWLVAPHMFLRFIGLSFLIPGVVSASLPKAWAVPAGYGDFVAGILAIIATVRSHTWQGGPLRPCGYSMFGVRPICCSRFTKDSASVWNRVHWALGFTS